MKFINLLTESFVNKNYKNRFVDKETIISERLGILETSQLSRFLGWIKLKDKKYYRTCWKIERQIDYYSMQSDWNIYAIRFLPIDCLSRTIDNKARHVARG